MNEHKSELEARKEKLVELRNMKIKVDHSEIADFSKKYSQIRMKKLEESDKKRKDYFYCRLLLPICLK